MTWEIALTLAVLTSVVLALSFLRVGPDLVLLGGLTLLLVSGVVEAEAALKGFANPGLVAVAVLFVVAEGLRQTGAISFIGPALMGRTQSLRVAQTRMAVPAAVMSAFLNNTPVVAMTLPIINDWARKARMSVSHLLMPLSYATILGGLCTLVGTSTTLVVNGLLAAEQQRTLDARAGRPVSPPVAKRPVLEFENLREDRVGLGMFELAAVGIPAAAAGLGYLIICTRWLIPERKPAMARLDDPREYTVEMIVASTSPLVGKTIESAGLRHLPGMFLAEIERGPHVIVAVSPNEPLQANDRLVFVGIVESIVDLQKIPGLTPATDQTFKLSTPRSERSLVEAVVSNSCPILNQTIREAQFRGRYNAVVIAVARNGERINKKIGDIRMQPGDTLLLEAPPSFIELQRNNRDFFLVSQVENSTPLRHERAWIAQLILAAMVLSVATEWLDMLRAAMLAAGLMILTRCCRGSEARRSVDWSVLLTMGAGLGIGEALKASHTDRFLADGLISAVGTSPFAVLAVVYALTMIFTNIITAKAAAVLFFPIAMAASANLSVALGSNVNPLPFAVAVIVAAAASFATPVGYQTNLMVYGPGGYRSSDYLRLGGPLSLLVGLITVSLAPLVWPFFPAN